MNFLELAKCLKHCWVHYRQCVDTKRMSDEPDNLVNRNVLSRVHKVARDGSDVTSSGRQFHTWGQQPKMLVCQRWNGEPEAGRGSHCCKIEVLGDLEGRQRRWTGQGMMVHSHGGPCVPVRQFQLFGRRLVCGLTELRKIQLLLCMNLLFVN